MSTSYSLLEIEQEQYISKITISRPKQLNALNTKLIQELSDALDEFENTKETRVLIITGSGEKSFVAGADIKEFMEFTTTQAYQLSQKGQEILFDKIANFNKPVIAAINGYVLGGGLELALACHIRIASKNAKFGLPESKLGLIPGYGGTQRLTQIIGKGRSLEMMLSASTIGSKQALDWGIINHLTDTTEELIQKSIDLATNIASNAPTAISKILSINKLVDKQQQQGFLKEIELFSSCFQTEDFHEGISAFLEKRKPKF